MPDCSPTCDSLGFAGIANQKRYRLGLVSAIVGWGIVVGLGLSSLELYETRPGAVGTIPHEWPKASEIPRSTQSPTLVMFLHSQCPCSRASVEELARIVAVTRHRFSVHIYINQPAGWGDDQIRGPLWHSAVAIPGVQVHADREGVEAIRFGAKTSGQVVLFDTAGRLQFQGGITGARGHSGDNIGSSTVLDSLTDDASLHRGQSACAVYGCPLFVD